MKDVIAKAVKFRERLHRHPEIAGCEYKTCEAIREYLADIPGVRVLDPFLQTDTVAFIDGSRPGANVTLRADIDALAVAELTDAPFRSEIPGMMHACGHDVHIAILAGALEVLAARKDEFAGSIRFVFQPGEEGKAMARDLIAAGALQDPVPDFSAALHVEPGLPVGTVGVREGCMASSCQHYKVVFTGKGGHGSLPHLSINPILAAVSAVDQLQYVVTNRIDVQKPAVMSICTISGGSMDNVIPEKCQFGGTLRSLDNETAKDLISSLENVCQAVAEAHKVSVNISVYGNYPAVINGANGIDIAKKAAEKSGLAVRYLDVPAMSSEDFSCFLLNSEDGVFVRLGVGEDMPPLHNPSFLPPAEVIGTGIAFMVDTALEFLGRQA